MYLFLSVKLWVPFSDKPSGLLNKTYQKKDKKRQTDSQKKIFELIKACVRLSWTNTTEREEKNCVILSWNKGKVITIIWIERTMGAELTGKSFSPAISMAN